MTPSQSWRAAKPRSAKRPKRERYDVDSFRRAITYAIKKYNRQQEREGRKIPRWSPSRLRHARATEVRNQYGLDAAQSVLGHAHANVTEIYARKKLDEAVKIAKESG